MISPFADLKRHQEEKMRLCKTSVDEDRLKPVIKDLMCVTDHISEEEAVKRRKELNDLMVSPLDLSESVDVPAPVTSFEEGVNGNEALLSEFQRVGFTKPSPIQCQMWPCLLKGIDCVGVSQTGSGKTLAFLIPAFLHLDAQLKQYGSGQELPCPSVLILTPTRELALQIKGEVDKYSYNGYKSVCLYGGRDGGRNAQVQECKKGVHIAIATPGRLADLASADIIKLGTVTYVVLDEADRMLDDGFEHDISRVMIEVRKDRITVLTSATWPEKVRVLAQRYMKKAAMIVVGTLDLTSCKSVKQYFEYFENDDEKKGRLIECLKMLIQSYGDKFKLIVFVAKKIYADDVSSNLCLEGIESGALHSGRSQEVREETLDAFRCGRVRILIATDVASRGIDVPNVTHVINFDFPSDVEEYVHRVGRTGRAGRSGESLTFLTYRNRDIAARMIDILQKSGQEIPQCLEDMAERWQRVLANGGPRGRGRGRGGYNRDRGNSGY